MWEDTWKRFRVRKKVVTSSLLPSSLADRCCITEGGARGYAYLSTCIRRISLTVDTEWVFMY